MFPYVKQRSERNDRTIEELVQIRQLLEKMRYEASVQSEQLKEFSRDMAGCGKLSEAAIEFVNNHLNPLTPVQRRRRERNVTRDELLDAVSE